MNIRSLNILLADDDPSVCLILSTILGRLGHTIEVVYNGKDAIRQFTVNPGYYDIFITDHNMPLVSGLEVVNYLRANEFEGRIVVISGFLTDELTTAYRARRVDKILQKPFSLEHLSSTLSDAFEQWK